jgi:hypothetical protein
MMDEIIQGNQKGSSDEQQAIERTYDPEFELIYARAAILRAKKGFEQAGKLTPDIEGKLNTFWRDLHGYSNHLAGQRVFEGLCKGINKA